MFLTSGLFIVMKITHFNRKRIIFVLSLLLILLLISVFCSFSFRPNDYTISYYPDRPTVEAVQNFMSIIQYQKDLNGLNRSDNILLLSCRYVNNVGYRITVYISSSSSFNYTVNGDVINFTFTGTQILYFNDSTGFYGAVSMNSDSINIKDIYYSSIALPETSIPGFQGFNSNANFGTSNFNSYDVMSYFKHIHDAALYLDEYVSEAYSEGLATGQGEGYQIGLDEGYNQGYDSGYADGENRGYIEGQTEGYSEGYSEGYDFGVENGYRLGFDEGKEEGYSEGYSQGESNGYSSGHHVGFDEGREEGYTLGFDNGYSEGYTEGYSEGYETGYNIVYDDLQQPGTIEAIFTTKDSSGNTLYLAQEADIENLTINYAFLPKDQLSDSYVGYRIYVKTYDVTKYLQDNPLDFDYPLPVIEYQNTDFLALYRKVNVTREYFDLYRVYSYVEVKIDQSFINQLNNQYNEGLNDANALVNGIGDMAAKPIVSLKDALDFEIFDLNIGVVAVGIVAILFAIWAYNKIRKVLPI